MRCLTKFKISAYESDKYQIRSDEMKYVGSRTYKEPKASRALAFIITISCIKDLASNHALNEGPK